PPTPTPITSTTLYRSFSPRDQVLMMFYKRLRELAVPEMMASILHETPGKPWKYYADMSRQLWDEARHSLLGEVGFVSLGLDWSQDRKSTRLNSSHVKT